MFTVAAQQAHLRQKLDVLQCKERQSGQTNGHAGIVESTVQQMHNNLNREEENSATQMPLTVLLRSQKICIAGKTTRILTFPGCH